LIDKALRDFDLVESVRSVLVFSVVFEHKISTPHSSVGGLCCDHDHTLVCLLYDVLAQPRRFFNNWQQRSRNCLLPASVSPLITNKRGARVWSLLGWVCAPRGGAHEETRDQTARSSTCQGEGAATVLAVKHTEPVLRAMRSMFQHRIQNDQRLPHTSGQHHLCGVAQLGPAIRILRRRSRVQHSLVWRQY